MKISPHLKCVTTVPSNLSLITALVCDCRSFSEVNVSRGSIAMHMRCGGLFSKHCAANLMENLTVKIILIIELTELLPRVWCLPFFGIQCML